ncbi:hypothetical protein [Serratia marcescens]|uniref:hypothetical protein n=1 Tax=Serratia marcescens TaxID=615 RepID=UPI0013DAFED1|nr:hypothetical protein [Serratia marcescens]NSM15639.1 hypothetical protein [Serratia marcescens]NSM97649.1 hypothetical protein [Serratia marcescens]
MSDAEASVAIRAKCKPECAERVGGGGNAAAGWQPGDDGAAQRATHTVGVSTSLRAFLLLVRVSEINSDRLPMRNITGIPVLLRSCEFTNHLPGRRIQVYFYLGYVLDERMEINVIVIKIKNPFSEIPV